MLPPRPARWIGAAALLALAAHACAVEPDRPASGEPSVPPPPVASADDPDERVHLGDGFVVWESNRTGRFRLWFRHLDGDDLRQLTPDDGDHEHCCPHLSPDGSSLAWLRLAPGQEPYPAATAAELHLLRLADGADRRIADGARTYYENRAVVWVDDQVLHYIDAEGHSVRLDIDSGERTLLTASPRSERGWLVDATGSWATDGDPTFSRYDRDGQSILDRRPFGGCQPYFSHDGVWGFWMAGAGGPLNRIELTTRQVGTVLRKNDPLLPPDRGYVYFPMLSRAGDLLAFAASDNEHEHFTSDYDVFVVETDPETLELAGRPVRMTTDAATDRYPDVFRPSLPLGRHVGEAPYTVDLHATEGGVWVWDLGDGETARGQRVRHTWAQPGLHPIRATSGDQTLAGHVLVRPPRPPSITAVEARGERTWSIRFDEPVDLGDATASLSSGGGVSVRADGLRAAVIELRTPLERPAMLSLRGVTDRAQVANRLRDTTARLEPAVGWPSERRDLVFLFETADRDNLVFDPSTGGERAWGVAQQGLATVDHAHALVTQGGHFAAPWEAAQVLSAAAKHSNELTLEATLTPADLDVGHRARIITSSSGPRARNFSLVQHGDRVSLVLRTSMSPPNGAEVELGRFREIRAYHVLVSYAPGRLMAFFDGRQVLDTDAIQGDFYHWKDRALILGDEWQGGHAWHGTIEGVAIYTRALDAAEATENHRRYRHLLSTRPTVERRTVRARLTACSHPATLEEIAPYRRALMLCAWRTSSGEQLRVAHWSLLDGRDITPPAFGEERELTLETFAANTQLHSDVLADTLDEDLDATLYYALGGLSGSTPAVAR